MSSPALTPRAIDDACALIFHRWRAFLPHLEALNQAALFRARCASLAIAPAAPDPALDAVLDAVACAMASDDMAAA